MQGRIFTLVRRRRAHQLLPGVASGTVSRRPAADQRRGRASLPGVHLPQQADPLVEREVLRPNRLPG